MELQCLPFTKGPGPDLDIPNKKVGGYYITSLFGGREDPMNPGHYGNHGGEDIAGFGDGMPYYAPIDGVAYPIWDGGGGGNWTTIYTPDGRARVGIGHQRAFAPGWVAGGRYVVKAGDLIGYADSTGASTGTHLHFAYDSEDPDTAYNDPYDILNNAARNKRYPGGAIMPPPSPIPSPEEDMNEAEHNMLMDIHNYVDPLGLNSIQDTIHEVGQAGVVFTLNGVKYLTEQSAAEIVSSVNSGKFDSRDFAFCYEGEPAVFMWVDTADGRKRQWIQNPTDLGDLVMTKLNPHIVVFPTDRKQGHNDRFPIVGPAPA